MSRASLPGQPGPGQPGGGSEQTLRLPDDWRDRLASWARACAPREACGLLLGRGAQADSSAVERALWAPNLATEPDRFELDPGAQLRAERIAGETGLELLGVWHSHPRGDARASARDRAGAWSPWWYLIVGLGDAGSGGTGAADFAAWRACVDGALESGRLV